MVNTIIRLFKKYSWFKRLNAKVTYELLGKYFRSKDWQFMNYGYYPNDGEMPPQFNPETAPQFYSTAMYHLLANKTEIEGKYILEVGSGRGGGGKHISQHFNPLQYVGIDLSQNAVNFCNEIHSLPNLKFIVGSAEAIPLEDQSMDVVLNVESSHAYGSVPKFFNEVKRVLKPSGHFLMVDFRNSPQTLEILKKQLSESNMTIIEEENISQHVLKAIEAEDHVKRNHIEKMIPKRAQKLFSEFAGVVGSPFYNSLKSGQRTYWRFHLRNF